MASILPDLNSEPQYVTPAEIYHLTNQAEPPPIRLRIATGGAGQSGLLRELAKSFIAKKTKDEDASPFSIAWLASDTTASFNNLASRAADLSITYHPVAEAITIKQGVAERSVYGWRDHWLLVGPKKNPAQLNSVDDISIHDHFSQLFQAAIATSRSDDPVRFLSRYDKSAANIKESGIWTAIGQTPWADPLSTWYHRYVEFPFAALRAAALLGEYTLTDRGSWYAIDESVRERMTVFKAGGDAEDDTLLNPAHALVGKHAVNKDLANEFAEWLADTTGGQQVIKNFGVGGMVLYSCAPHS